MPTQQDIYARKALKWRPVDDRLGAALLLFLLACAIACAGLLDNPDITMPWEDTADAYLF